MVEKCSWQLHYILQFKVILRRHWPWILWKWARQCSVASWDLKLLITCTRRHKVSSHICYSTCFKHQRGMKIYLSSACFSTHNFCTVKSQVTVCGGITWDKLVISSVIEFGLITGASELTSNDRCCYDILKSNNMESESSKITNYCENVEPSSGHLC